MVEPTRAKYQHLKLKKDVNYMQLYWDSHHVAEPHWVRATLKARKRCQIRAIVLGFASCQILELEKLKRHCKKKIYITSYTYFTPKYVSNVWKIDFTHFKYLSSILEKLFTSGNWFRPFLKIISIEKQFHPFQKTHYAHFAKLISI